MLGHGIFSGHVHAGLCTSCSCAYSTYLDQLSKDRIGVASQFSPLLFSSPWWSVMHALKKRALHSPPFVHFATGASGYIWCGVVCWAGHFTFHMQPFMLYLPP